MKLKIDGQTIPAVSVDQGARTIDVMELQIQSGYTLAKIRQIAKYEMVSVALMVFLSMSRAGLEPSWSDLTERNLARDVELVKEPGDEARTKEALARAGLTPDSEGEQSLDPLSAATLAVDDQPAPNRAARRQNGSKKKNRASSHR